MKKVRNVLLTGGIVFAVLISSTNLVLSAIEFEKGEPSQIRELILKQKQEKKRLVTEKYKKQKQEQETALQEKIKLKTSEKPVESQKQPASFTKLKTLLIIGLLLLTILSITLGITINRRRQGK